MKKIIEEYKLGNPDPAIITLVSGLVKEYVEELLDGDCYMQVFYVDAANVRKAYEKVLGTSLEGTLIPPRERENFAASSCYSLLGTDYLIVNATKSRFSLYEEIEGILLHEILHLRKGRNLYPPVGIVDTLAHIAHAEYVVEAETAKLNPFSHFLTFAQDFRETIEALKDSKFVPLDQQAIIRNHSILTAIRNSEHPYKLSSSYEKITTEYEEEFQKWMTDEARVFYEKVREKLTPDILASQEKTYEKLVSLIYGGN